MEAERAFSDLPVYSSESIAKTTDSSIVKVIAIRREEPSVFALCMAARLYPDKFNIDRMVAFLCAKYSAVKKMQPHGRSNVISLYMQTKPPLITFMHGKMYRWTSEIDNVTGAAELSELLTANFGVEAPTKEDLKAVSE